MKYQPLIIALLGLSLGAVGAATSAANISGTWASSVDTGSGLRPDGTLVFKQGGEKLTGSYSGGMGEYKFIGTVRGDKVVFSFDKTFPGRPEPFKVIFTGTIESPSKMTGTFEGPKGRPNWTATKK